MKSLGTLSSLAWSALRISSLAVVGMAAGCVVRSDIPTQTYRLEVSLTMADGSPLPAEDTPLCLDLRGVANDVRPEDPTCTEWTGPRPAWPPDSLRNGHDFSLSVKALDNQGNLDTTFNGYVRITVRPGTVASVSGDSSNGRNIKLTNGVAAAQTVRLVGTFGPTRIEAQDLGYLPADPTSKNKPQCADGIDNNGNGLVDYPADPGCEYANDDSEDFGTAAAGLAPTIWFRYPSIEDVQGYGLGTPFQSEGVVAETRPEKGSNLIVTRILSQGFEVSDVTPNTAPGAIPNSYTVKNWGSLYVFNFGLPDGIEVCDRVTYLAGSMDEFFGYTEMDFPSYDVHPWDTKTDGPCQVPQPIVLGKGQVSSKTEASELQMYMSSLVEVDGAHIATHFGPGLPAMAPLPGGDANCSGTTSFTFDQDHSDCDLNGDGTTNFETDTDEANCFCFCFYDDPECSEWSGYRSRGNFRLVLDTADAQQSIQANTQSVENFDPRVSVGKELPHLRGTLSKFSGGNLNWTIEARCTSDLCKQVDDPKNPGQLISDPNCLTDGQSLPLEDVSTACVLQRTAADNDSASN